MLRTLCVNMSTFGFTADRSTEAGPGSGSASADGDKSPWSNSNFSSTGPPAKTGVTDARLISAVSAGIKGLLAERAAAADALRDLVSSA